MKFNVKPEQLPKHVAIIMDGNGRWATKRLLPRKAGHREGVKCIQRIVADIFALNIPYVSLFAFSTENQNRPKDEVESLFQLMTKYFGTFLEDSIKNDIKLRFMGDLLFFPEELRKIINDAVAASKNCKKGTLNIALNYGGRAEIIRAANLAMAQGKELTQENFAKFLYTDGMPDPDILIRTGGEMRISNFMLYQSAYTELFFTPTLWPDFGKEELYSILEQFSKRNRRFGKI